MPTYGLRPDDLVRDSRGDVAIDLKQTFYASRPDAEMQVNPLGTATSAKDGRWQFTHTASGVFGRDPEGNIRFYDSEEPKLTEVAASSAYARPGKGAFVALGDSLTNNTGIYTESPQFYQDSVPNHLAAASGGALRLIRNAGVSGNSTAQMLARFDTDVTPYSPGMVTVMGGTNDVNSVPLATTQANLQAIVAKIRAIGAVPVLYTIPPYTFSGSGKANAVALNAWIRRYCQQQGILCLDAYKNVVDPATGGILAAYSQGDNVHFNEAAHPYLAGIFAPQVTQHLGAAPAPLLTYDDTDANNLLVGGLFLSAATSGIAGGWANYSGANTNGNTASVTTDANVPGNMQTITASAATGGATIGQNIVAGKLVAGHRLALSGIMTHTGPLNYAQVRVTLNGPGTQIVWRTKRPLTRANFYAEFVVPSGVTSADVILGTSTGTGSLSVGQFTLYDLTALGL